MKYQPIQRLRRPGGDEKAGRQQLLAAFAQLSRTYEQILHAAGEGIFSFDPAGRIGFANPAGTALLGWTMEDLLSRSVCEVVHGADGHGGAPCPLLGAPPAEQRQRRDVFRRRDGAEAVVEYSLAPIRDEGGLLGAALVFRDIGERERNERALRESLAAVKESNERLSVARDQLLQAEKLAAIGQLAAGVAHEINTPLGYIGSNISSLRFDTENLLALVEAHERAAAAPGDSAAAAELAAARRRCDLDFMREDAPALLRETGAGLAKVARIVRELREYANADEPGEWQWREPDRLLEEALADALARADRPVRIERDYAAVPPIHCLAAGLRQALAGLVLNALQALAPDGRVALRIRPGAAGEVLLEIDDDGVGIAPEILPRVRDPFFTTRPVGDGIGMGLSVAETLVHRHGGHIDIASWPGCGTQVSVSLPLRQNGE